MYVVTEADAAAIREVYERDGELSAAIVSIGTQNWRKVMHRSAQITRRREDGL